MNRKRISSIVALAATLASGSLWAAPTTIVFWHNYGDIETPFLENTVIPLFEKANPGVDVQAVRQDNNNYNQLVVAAMSTGSLPDAARIEITRVAGYAAQGALAPLDGMKGFAEAKASVYESTLSTNLYRGKYYGLPLDTNCKAAVYNLKNLAAIGLKSPPKTLDELVAAARKNPKAGFAINVSGLGDWDILPWFWLCGGVATDPGFTKASGYLDSKASVAAMSKLLELHSAGIFTVRDIDGSVDAWQAIKEPGLCLFLEGPWFFSANPDYAASQIAAAPVPSVNGKSASVIGGEDIVMFSTAKNKELSWKFIQFMLSPEVQDLLASVNQMPVVKSVADRLSGKGVWPIYLEQLKSSNARIPSPQSATIETLLKDCFTSCFDGSDTPEKALKKAAGLIDKELAK
jgi:multiple sugar transport system substrate-binding protein